MWRRRRRVYLHLFDRLETDIAGNGSPRFEGLLLSRRRREYLLADYQLLHSPEAVPVRPTGPLAAVPRENVMWIEVLS